MTPPVDPDPEAPPPLEAWLPVAMSTKAKEGDHGTHVMEIHLDLAAFGEDADRLAVLALVPATQAINEFLKRRRAV